MSPETLRANLEAIFSRAYHLSEVFHSVYKYNADLPTEISNDISEKLAIGYIKKLDAHQGEAKLLYLNDCESEFRHDCKFTIAFTPEVNERLYIIARNTLAIIEDKRQDILGQPSILHRVPIQINCEITTFLHLISCVLNESSKKEVTKYRIAQLVADNFSDGDGKPIDMDYCKKKFSTSIGTSDVTNNKVRRILKNSIESLDK